VAKFAKFNEVDRAGINPAPPSALRFLASDYWLLASGFDFVI